MCFYYLKYYNRHFSSYIKCYEVLAEVLHTSDYLTKLKTYVCFHVGYRTRKAGGRGRDRKERGRTVGKALFLCEILCGTNRFLYYDVRYTARSLVHNAPYLYTSIVNLH